MRGIGVRIGLAGMISAIALTLVPAAQAASGDVLVGQDNGAQNVLRIKPDGTQQVVATGAPLVAPGGLGFARDGNLYVADYDLPGIVRLTNGVAPAQSLVSGPPFDETTDLVVGPDKQIYAADYSGLNSGAIFKVDPTNGTFTTLSTGGNFDTGPLAITAAPDGTLFVADQDGKVVEVDPTTGAQRLVSSGGLLEQFTNGIARALDGTLYLYVDAPGNADRIVRINPGNGTQTTISTGGLLQGGYDLVLEPTGTLLLANLGGDNIIRINRTTGTQTVAFTGTNLDNPEGLALEPPRCAGLLATVVGTTANDKIKASSSPDVIAALQGNDTVNGLGGADIVCGGPGKDKLRGGAGRDALNGEGGKDTLNGGGGKDKLRGGGGKDKLRGGPGRDRLKGGGGKDRLNGGGGNDTCVGDAARQLSC